MAKSTHDSLVAEILSALETVGEIERWLQRYMGGSVDGSLASKTFRDVTRLLLAKPPRTADWERLLVAAAVISTKPKNQAAYDACKAAIDQVAEMIEQDLMADTAPEHIVTLASALTLVLAAQRKLRQPVETIVGSLCEKFADLMPQMAQRCQDLWQRKGQMSGTEGLFVWDMRHGGWRLRQDFKSYRPRSVE